MSEPPVAEAILIEDGVVRAVGTRDDVLAGAVADVPVIDIGESVAYPGFIDAHAHWIGDRNYYRVETPAEAMNLAGTRGWTSISEQWVNQEKLDELTALAAENALPLRVDAYLALNFDKEFFGDWYADREPGPVDDWLRVRGLKIHLDTGSGKIINWEPADLTATIGRANDAGWQVSVHTMSSAAQELVLDAFEAAIGPNGPNPLHHRIEHATQVTDEELARMVAMDLVTVIHLDGEGDWIMSDGFLADFDRTNPGPEIEATVGRWRDFVDAGLHVASATDAPWTFNDDFGYTDDMARPVDQIAAGMDGKARSVPEMPAWLLDQTLTAEQGLRAVTLDAAWALGDEARRGHLAPGSFGDVTILSGDVTEAAADEIRAMKVVATIVGGIPVYCAGSEVCSDLGGHSL
ncbi:MAG TPA: amidohydrolase family protein [Candidatus Limnocylindrales bacterium]|nr:amidohydrolase family protein [Candidatus Limnocylindrales bacterium]